MLRIMSDYLNINYVLLGVTNLSISLGVIKQLALSEIKVYKHCQRKYNALFKCNVIPISFLNDFTSKACNSNSYT